MQNINDAKRVVRITGKHAYNLSTMEKRQTSTYIDEINAMGIAVPPMIIHKGKVVAKNWKTGLLMAR